MVEKRQRWFSCKWALSEWSEFSPSLENYLSTLYNGSFVFTYIEVSSSRYVFLYNPQNFKYKPILMIFISWTTLCLPFMSFQVQWITWGKDRLKRASSVYLYGEHSREQQRSLGVCSRGLGQLRATSDPEGVLPLCGQGSLQPSGTLVKRGEVDQFSNTL